MKILTTILKILLFIAICFTVCNSSYGQNDSLKNRLTEIAENELPALNNTISLSVSNLNVGELVRAITRETGVNVYIPNRLNPQITSNFSGVRVKDILYYLCVEYNLQCDIVGSIIRLTTIPEPLQSQPDISYNESTKTITYDIKNILIEDVAKRITDFTGINIIPSQSIKSISISGFGKDVDVEDAFTQLGFVNGFTVRKVGNNQLVLVPIAQQTANGAQGGSGDNFGFSSRDINVSVDENGLVDISVSNADLQWLFVSLMQKAGITYKILNPISGTISLNSTKITLKDCLYRMFKGTVFTYRIEGELCFAGTRDNPGLKCCKLIELDYRSAEALNKQLPASYISGVEWMDFPEMNAIILFGDSDRISEIESFICSIDKRVPVILIDVIIADISKNLSFDWMFDIGIGEKPAQIGGQYISSNGMNMTFGASSINSAMGKLGLSSIGKVSPNFYANIKMMEENGWAKVRSTPRLSTLNAKEATLKIGRTEYYEEKMNSYIGSMDPQLSTQTIYKSVDAELSVKIRPIVSGDGSVTIAVEVIQSDFTERVSQYGPPGLRSRSFKSEIQVNNDEMILLGGLEESTNLETNKGVPFISRIPVIKWFFGGKSKVKNETQLTIFIKPTIIN
ncbi:MAG: type II and III secretion system protein [Prevotellaceae bacterium]|jgi:type IV pilus assembly protein PilQ|nr:type II and III secretion system protein [Prevotellaceae bacterium]